MRPVPVLLVAVLLAGCQTRPKDSQKPLSTLKPGEDRPFFVGNEDLQTDIQQLIERFADATVAQELQISARLARYGEPAVPPLVQALRHPHEDVRMGSAHTLGLIRDPRAIPALDAALDDPSEPVRYQAAAALLGCGDARGYDLLIVGLEHVDPRIRQHSIRVLKLHAEQDLGYVFNADPEDRAAAVSRWRAWRERQRASLGR